MELVDERIPRRDLVAADVPRARERAGPESEGGLLPARARGHGRRHRRGVPGLHRQPLVLPARRELLPARVRRGRDRGRGRGGAAGGARAGRAARGGQPRPHRLTTSPTSAPRSWTSSTVSRSSGRQHRSMDTLVVSGAIANRPLNSGGAWVRLSWVLGLRRLGFDVWFVEQIDEATCVDAAGAPVAFAESENRRYFEQVVERFGLEGRASLLYEGGRESAGVPLAELLPVAQEARLLVNVSGHLDLEPLMSRLRRKAYVDLDPGFTQFWHADGTGGARLDGHDVHFTVGENIGRPDCPIPTCGLEWKAVRASRGARGLAGRRRRRHGSVHDDRRMARAVRPGALRRAHLLTEGARVPQGDRVAAPLAAAVRDRARHPSRRRARPRGARGERLAPGRPARDRPRTARVP